MKRIFVAGHRGMVGSAIVRALNRAGDCHLILRTHQECDLTDPRAVNQLFMQECPEEIYLSAAKVGGIYANNTYPADFIYQNLMIAANVIHAAFTSGVKRLLFLGSSCIYPRDVEQPMSEGALLTAKLELTNEPYAIAKIAGIKLCESYNRQYGVSHGINYRSLMPTNLYGIGDNYHPDNSHVIPGLIRRFHCAKAEGANEVIVWGSGKPLREFLFVDDLAEACLFTMNLPQEIFLQHTKPQESHLNVGSGIECSISELAKMIAQTVGFKGQIIYDASKPDGTMRKLMDSQRLNKLGWQAKTSLATGLAIAYQDYLSRL